MDYRMLGDILSIVEVRLQAGEAMYTQFGEMTWMSDGFILDSNVKGGFMKGLGRVLSGESLFMATYTASGPDSAIAFTSTVPGEVLTIDMIETNLICQEEVLLCAQTAVEIDTVLTKRLAAGFFGGEGFILQQIQGGGMAFLEVDGDMVERVLALGEVIKVDTGSVFAFEPNASYEIETMKGVKNTLFGDEGLFLTRLAGPSKVHMQTMSVAESTEQIAQGLPTSK